MFKSSVVFILFILSSSVWAVTEVNFDFGYDRTVYGDSRQNSVINRTYNGAIALYFFDYTALEFNYTNGKQVTSEKNKILITNTNYSIMEMQNRLTTQVFGVGLRQALSSSKSRIKPMISMGYARQFTDDSTDYTLEENTTHVRNIISGAHTKKRNDAVFGTFALQLGITRNFAIKGSVQTIFPAFVWNKVRDNLKYLAGLTWVF
ncbi:MAG: hypothetical protein WCG27_02385 [Pseudomonadota bacterium]